MFNFSLQPILASKDSEPVETVVDASEAPEVGAADVGENLETAVEAAAVGPSDQGVDDQPGADAIADAEDQS